MAQLTALPEIIGLPPSTPETEPIIKSTFPVMEIIPVLSKDFSQNVYKFSSAITQYKSILNAHGYSINGNSLKVAFLSDNFPTDTFSNFYAESFLGSGLQAVSDETSQIMQMLNARTGTEGAAQILRGIKAVGKATGLDWVGKAATGLGNIGSELQQKFNEVTGQLGPLGNVLQNTAALANRALGGGRIDLPQIWKNSGFTPSYTITVRLFNPNPGNSEVTKKFITGPLCAILALALPRTKGDGLFYDWPFFQQIRVPGLLNLPQSYIGNITVIKGGDQQLISYKQNMGMCDIRIEFGCLFDTMVADDGGRKITDRPSLKEYIEELESGRSIPIPIDTLGTYEEPELLLLRRVTSNSVRRTQEVGNVTGEAEARVSQQDARDYFQLVAENPAF
jgi:hypothetical protein